MKDNCHLEPLPPCCSSPGCNRLDPGIDREHIVHGVLGERPKDDFDYYRIEVIDNSNGDVEPYRVGSCANGSIVDAHQTQVTCDHIEPCANVTFRIRTYAKGPPERVSSGGCPRWHLHSRASSRLPERCVPTLVKANDEPNTLETT
ncbi:hypothetical protein MTO96_050129 [Rhipicephalus appendiculatus]